MKNYIKVEFKRALCNKNTFWAIFIGILCMIFGTETYLFNEMKTDSFYLFSFAYSSGTSSILIVIAPLLVCLPFSTSYLQEKQMHFHENVFIRINKLKYLITKILINGLMGGLTISLSLTISFFIFLIVKGPYTTMNLVNYLDLTNVSAYLYSLSPFLYVFFIIITSFLGGFTFSTIALSISTIIRNKYLSLIFPFLFNVFTGIFLERINELFYTINFLDVSYHGVNLVHIIIYEIIILSIFIGIFLYNSLKEGSEIEN